MSYCRWIDSDVYVFRNVHDQYECCGCGLVEDAASFACPDPQEMVEHLRHHREAGHLVHEYVLEALAWEQKAGPGFYGSQG